MLTEKFYGLDTATLNAILALNPTNYSAAAKSNQPPISQAANGTTIINVFGVLFPRPNFITLMGYGTSLEAIKAQLDSCINDHSVRKIILNFDSGGGAVAGINELASYIKASAKPINAFVSGQCCSAAYWLASACAQITCTSTSVMGSIGIVAIFQKNGPDVVEIVSNNAQNKRPDPSTEVGKSILLQTLNDLENEFIGALAKFRPKLTEQAIKSWQGGVFVGAKASQNGLADGLGSLSGTIAGVLPNRPITAQSDGSDSWAQAFAKTKKYNFPSENRQAAKQSEANSTDNALDNDGWAKSFARNNNR